MALHPSHQLPPVAVHPSHHLLPVVLHCSHELLPAALHPSRHLLPTFLHSFTNFHDRLSILLVNFHLWLFISTSASTCGPESKVGMRERDWLGLGGTQERSSVERKRRGGSGCSGQGGSGVRGECERGRGKLVRVKEGVSVGGRGSGWRLKEGEEPKEVGWRYGWKQRRWRKGRRRRLRTGKSDAES